MPKEGGRQKVGAGVPTFLQGVAPASRCLHRAERGLSPIVPALEAEAASPVSAGGWALEDVLVRRSPRRRRNRHRRNVLLLGVGGSAFAPKVAAVSCD